MKQHRLPLIAFLLALGLVASSARAFPAGLSFAGVPLAPGATVRANVPLSAVEKSYVAEAGNTVPPNAVAVLAVPANFNPSKTWPVLVVFSTSDFKILNRDDLVRLYRDTALAEGWVVLAGDGPGQPRLDTSGWRAGMTLAALDALHRSFPGSKNWPVACAGYSGGAKRAGLLAPLLALAGCRMSGLFLTGINVDRATDGYRQFKPGASYLRMPVFISTGSSDNVATPQQQSAVRASMIRTGFNPVRQEMFPGGHVVKRSHLAEALRWFRGR